MQAFKWRYYPVKSPVLECRSLFKVKTIFFPMKSFYNVFFFNSFKYCLLCMSESLFNFATSDFIQKWATLLRSHPLRSVWIVNSSRAAWCWDNSAQPHHFFFFSFLHLTSCSVTSSTRQRSAPSRSTCRTWSWRRDIWKTATTRWARSWPNFKHKVERCNTLSYQIQLYGPSLKSPKEYMYQCVKVLKNAATLLKSVVWHGWRL